MTLSTSGAMVGAYKPFSSPQSGYGSINDQYVFDPAELAGLLRAQTPSPDETKEEYEICAKQDYDQIITMDGRPTRPLQLQPTWTGVYKDGLIYITDNEGELECTLSDDIDPMFYHWQKESAHFRSELENWQEFRTYQQNLLQFDRLETELELENTDAGLIKALTRLSDWQEFEVFQYRILADALRLEDHCGQKLSQITRREISAEHPPLSSAGHDAIGRWLRSFDQSQEEVEAAKNQLGWIKSQWPKVVAEATDAILMTPEYQTVLEAKFRKQTHSTFSIIQKLRGRPSHAVKPPDESMDLLHRLLYWSSESSKYMEELQEWEFFLEWRRVKKGEKPSAQQQEYSCPQFQSELEISEEFEKFRLYQYNHALAWLKCRQRVVRWYEEEIETPRWYIDESEPTQSAIAPEFLDDCAEAARSHVRDSEQKLADAATRLERSRQEHARALLEHDQSTGGENKTECPQMPFQPTPNLSASESLRSFESSFSPSSSSRPSQSPQPPQSPQSLQLLQSSQSPSRSKHLSEDRRRPSKSSPTDKYDRTSKKKIARKERENVSKPNREQRDLPQFPSDSHNVNEEEGLQTRNASSLSPLEKKETLLGAELDDAVMTDFEDSLDHISSSSLQPLAKPKSKNLPPPSAHGPIPRKTPSAVKLDQATSSRVSKKSQKKPTKTAKAFTEQQTMMLLNAASTDVSPTPSALRRSERLKEKAAASAVVPVPQIHATPSSNTLQQKRAERGSESSRHQTRKTPPRALDTTKKSRRQKKLKTRSKVPESPQT